MLFCISSPCSRWLFIPPFDYASEEARELASSLASLID